MHEKIAKNTEKIPIDSFLFAIFNSTKIFSKYWSPMVGILLKLSRGHTLSRSRFPRKRYNWTQIHFVTHLLHQGHAWCRIDPEMADLEDFWVHWKCPKIWRNQKSVGKLRQHRFWMFLRSLVLNLKSEFRWKFWFSSYQIWWLWLSATVLVSTVTMDNPCCERLSSTLCLILYF